MVARASRRDFLRADFLRPEVVRPYGAVASPSFEKLCDGCGDCAAACPEAIVLRAEDGLARIDLTLGECTFCGKCTEACPTGALSVEGQESWNWVARVGDACLSIRGVTCRTCEDFCDERAIRFRLETGGRSRPLIDEAGCTGCGACASTCPEGAISFARLTAEQTNQGELTA